MLETIFQLFSLLAKGVRSTSACESSFHGGCYALGSHWTCQSPPVPHPLRTASGRWGPSQLWPSCFRDSYVLVSPDSLPSSQTENSDPPRRLWVNSNRRRRRRPVNGLHHSREGGPPNTAFIPSHLMRRSHVGFSFLSRSISCKTFTPLCY